MSLRQHLEQVIADYGTLTPANVVDAATEPDHPLHERFEWDDSIAGPKYRLQQARQMIRTVRCSYVTASGTPSSVRVFHSMPADDSRAYELLDDIVVNPVAHDVLVAQMRRDWAAFEARYGHLVEFMTIVGGAKR